MLAIVCADGNKEKGGSHAINWEITYRLIREVTDIRKKRQNSLHWRETASSDTEDKRKRILVTLQKMASLNATTEKSRLLHRQGPFIFSGRKLEGDAEEEKSPSNIGLLT